MSKQGMKRYDPPHPKNDVPPVPQLQGKAKTGKQKARPLITGTVGKVFHAVPHEDRTPAVFPAIDNDLAVENLVNDFDMTAADRQDLEG